MFLFFSILFLALVIYNLFFLQHQNTIVNGNYELIKNTSKTLIFKHKNIYFQIYNKKEQFEINQNIEFKNIFYIKGILQKIKNTNLFNYRNQIFFKLNLIEIKFVGSYVNNDFIFHKNNIVKEYLNIIVLNKYTNSSNIYKKLFDLNIIHFFTISGFHFNLIYFFSSFVLKKIKIKQPYNELISILFLIIYLLIIGFKISAIRATLFIILIFLNKNFLNNKFNKISLLSISAFIMVIYNPYLFLSYSFILSYVITLIILITINLFKNFNFYIKSIFIILIAHFSSTLIIHTFQEKYNFFSIFIQILISPFISINFILSIFLFKTNKLIEKIIIYFDNFLSLLNKSSFYINFKVLDEICIFLHFGFIFLYKIKNLQLKS